MRRIFERDERGISPVVATILLIAATVAAAGVIATWVGGLYISSTTVVAGSFSGNVIDGTVGTGYEFRNENVIITVELTSGSISDVGDSSTGVQVRLGSQTLGWGPTIFGPTGDTSYPISDLASSLDIVTTGGVTVTVGYKISIPTDDTGRWRGGTTQINLKPTAISDNTNNQFRGENARLWDENNTDLTILVIGQGGRRSFTSSFGTVRLFASYQ